MIVTAHQPNYLPSVSIIEKVRSSDAVIWLDQAQFSHGGWTSRNKLPDGSWLSVPVEHGIAAQAINRIRISEHRDWRKTHCKAIKQAWGAATLPFCDEIRKPYKLLISLNLACLRLLLANSETQWHFQSHLDGGHALDFSLTDQMQPISNRLALMVAEIGGTTYLSGPSGRHYLDETPFADLGIEVQYWPGGQHRCALSAMQVRSTYQSV